jgi:hypothetical protein
MPDNPRWNTGQGARETLVAAVRKHWEEIVVGGQEAWLVVSSQITNGDQALVKNASRDSPTFTWIEAERVWKFSEGKPFPPPEANAAHDGAAIQEPVETSGATSEGSRTESTDLHGQPTPTDESASKRSIAKDPPSASDRAEVPTTERGPSGETGHTQATDRDHRTLSLSLISSFCMDGPDNTQSAWSKLESPVPAEQYVWMQRDVDETINKVLGKRHGFELTAVDVLASMPPTLLNLSESVGSIGPDKRAGVLGRLQGTYKRIRRVWNVVSKLSADPNVRNWLAGSELDVIGLIDSFFVNGDDKPLLQKALMGYLVLRYLGLKAGDRRLETVAFATFIPEIAAAPDSDRGKRAQAAIRCLGALAVNLHEAQQLTNQPVRVSRIELVAGSRIGQVFRSVPLDVARGGFIAEVLPVEKVHENILTNLDKALGGAEQAALRERLHEYGIAYVFEQEPGPLFALGTSAAISDFCERLEKCNASWNRLVGLNVDIPHWLMSGLNANLIGAHREDKDEERKRKQVYDRIAHAHISGHHSKAHFGDTSLKHLSKKQMRDYKAFVELLRELPHTEKMGADRRYPGFGGYVSVEFEAAPSIEEVDSSLAAAKELLGVK